MVLTLLRKRRDFVPRNNGWLSMLRVKVLFGLIKEAAEALSQHGKSLLLSGIVEAEGAFSYGDIVTVFDKESGKSLGKGRVQFGASALEDMLRSQKAKGVLIHRDDWISITPEIQLLYRILEVNYGKYTRTI